MLPPFSFPPPLSEHFLDARGLLCPLPILKAKKILNQLDSGTILEIWVTDLSAIPDFRAFCAQTGHIFVKTEEQTALSSHTLVKGDPKNQNRTIFRIDIQKR